MRSRASRRVSVSGDLTCAITLGALLPMAGVAELLSKQRTTHKRTQMHGSSCCSRHGGALSSHKGRT